MAEYPGKTKNRRTFGNTETSLGSSLVWPEKFQQSKRVSELDLKPFYFAGNFLFPVSGNYLTLADLTDFAMFFAVRKVYGNTNNHPDK